MYLIKMSKLLLKANTTISMKNASEKYCMGFFIFSAVTVNHRITVILLSAGIFMGSLFLFKVVPTEFFPQQDSARLSLTVRLPINTRAEITKELAFRIHDQFKRDYPEIIAMTFTVGQASEDNIFGQLGTSGPHIMTGNIRLTLKTERKRSM
jgi:HAE1 family hydrophobic/amphiphilic exporter-1